MFFIENFRKIADSAPVNIVESLGCGLCEREAVLKVVSRFYG